MTVLAFERRTQPTDPSPRVRLFVRVNFFLLSSSFLSTETFFLLELRLFRREALSRWNPDVDDSWFVDRLNSSVSEWSGLVTRIEPSREDLAVAALRLESSCDSVMSLPIWTTGSGDDTTTD
jgi:hypothetical protein